MRECPACEPVFLYAPRKTRPRIARPPESRQAPTEGSRDLRRHKRLGIVQPARSRVAQGRIMQRQKILPALAGSAGSWIMEQISFRGHALQDGHSHARRLPQGIAASHFPSIAIARLIASANILENQPGDKHRTFQIRKRVSESLGCMHSAQRLNIIRCVFANAQSRLIPGSTGLNLCHFFPGTSDVAQK
jgi:hypothetical protein